MRGGGHMPIPGYNGIDSSGVLLSSSNLTTLSLSANKSIVSVEPGNRWRDVYAYLKPFGLAAVGGRVGHVGVPGLLLGGGISFYSSQFGFASDNVAKYQCVLSSGLIVEATATNAYSDLFWALRGRRQFILYRAIWTACTTLENTVVLQTPRLPSYRLSLTFPAANLTVYAAAKFYNSVINDPEVFENFTAPKLIPVADSYTLQPLSDYIAATDALQPLGLRQEFRTMSSVVDRDAVQLIHDAFIAGVNNKLSNMTNLQASVTFQPVSKDFVSHSAKTGGNPQGIDVSKAPFFWMVENFTWTSASDDTKVRAAADEITASINGLLEAKLYNAQYLYMNDAGKGQPVFQSYPATNLRKLKAIRSKYDPFRVYTDLMPGGWKVAHT
ncbi:FAD binding domain-containing protein [Pyrenophora tritici-repentis]|nr:FAD binding domain-containing protein [Pyrenophora tritici-repentis]